MTEPSALPSSERTSEAVASTPEAAVSAIRREFGAAHIVFDAGSGIVVALISVAYSLSFAALIFSGRLADCVGLGVAPMLLSAGLGTLVIVSLSSSRFVVAGADTATVAVLSALASEVAATTAAAQPPAVCTHTLFALSATTIVTGACLLAMGALRFGVWMRYIPYPVIGGFLAASGYLLAVGSIKVITGKPASWHVFVDADDLARLAVGAAITAIIVAGRRMIRHPLALPIVLLAAIAAFHACLLALDIPLAAARAAGWFLPALTAGPLLPPWQPDVWQSIDWSLLTPEIGAAAAAVGVTAVAVLLNSSGLEVAERTSLDLDRELRAHGFANLVCGGTGGVITNMALNRTLLNKAVGAQSRLSSVIAGSLCVAAIVAGPEKLELVPTPVLGGMLLFLGLSLVWTWVAKAPMRLGRSDYALVLAILTLIVFRGYLEGILLGVIASCLNFAFRYSRVRIIKHDLTRKEFSSVVERGPEDAAFLEGQGDRINVLWIQGFLFFGSANRLLQTVSTRIGARETGMRRTVILDFAEVTGIDSSAVFSFQKLADSGRANNVRLVFSGLSGKLRKRFDKEGLFGDGTITELDNVDSAMEWAEEQLLADRPAGETAALGFQDWLADQLGGAALAERFRTYTASLVLEPQQYLFRQGEVADALYFVESGRISILLTPPDGEPIRLRSVARCTVVGEMGLYRGLTRVASIVADAPSQVLRMSRDDLRRMQARDPEVASAFHALIVRILADRLAFANAGNAALRR